MEELTLIQSSSKGKGFTKGESKRGFASLKKIIPLPLIKGEGGQGDRVTKERKGKISKKS